MGISDNLIELKLISGSKISEIFDSLYDDILTIEYSSESELVRNLWARYKPSSPALNGSVFEGILATILYRSKITPLYVQAKLTFVPNIDFDFIAYSEEFGPIVLSAKTSLRERYKQADLEGMMLRQVHRRSKSYLITLNKPEAKSANEKIKNGLILGFDDVVVADSADFDLLINQLKDLNYYEPGKIDVLTSSRLIK